MIFCAKFDIKPGLFLCISEQVTEDDIRALAKQMLQTKPSMAALGLLDRLPDYKEIVSVSESGEALKQPAKSLFRR